MKDFMQLLILFIFIRTGYCSECDNIQSARSLIEDNFSSISSDFKRTLNSDIDVKFSEDALLNFTGLANKYIRPSEEFDVITEDGYVLKLFHIPGNASNVLLICHGNLDTSDAFILRGNTSLITMLAKQGFDIWAMNFRGNRYSRRHIKLNPDKDSAFWHFSMHEVGVYDYKTVIDFILNKTGQEKLSVVAHSLGTSAFFILTSERPEYNDKVKIFAGLAPITYLNDSGPTLSTIFKLLPILIMIIRVAFEEFLGYYSFTKRVIDVVCSQGTIGPEFCFNILGSITGFDPENIEPEFIKTILGHFPAGTSIVSFEHYNFVNLYSNFVKYDYKLKNLAVYGTFFPPLYDLKKVTTKVALFGAKSDLVVGIKDVERLRSVLRNVVHYEVVSDEKFNHIDYMWGRNAYKVLYPDVINVLGKYS